MSFWLIKTSFKTHHRILCNWLLCHAVGRKTTSSCHKDSYKWCHQFRTVSCYLLRRCKPLHKNKSACCCYLPCTDCRSGTSDPRMGLMLFLKSQISCISYNDYMVIVYYNHNNVLNTASITTWSCSSNSYFSLLLAWSFFHCASTRISLSICSTDLLLYWQFLKAYSGTQTNWMSLWC